MGFENYVDRVQWHFQHATGEPLPRTNANADLLRKCYDAEKTPAQAVSILIDPVANKASELKKTRQDETVNDTKSGDGTDSITTDAKTNPV